MDIGTLVLVVVASYFILMLGWVLLFPSGKRWLARQMSDRQQREERIHTFTRGKERVTLLKGHMIVIESQDQVVKGINDNFDRMEKICEGIQDPRLRERALARNEENRRKALEAFDLGDAG